MGAAHDDVDAVVDDVRGAVEEATAERQEAERGQVAVILGILGNLVSGDLETQELIVRQVLVESVYYPVAVGVGVGVTALFLEDIALRVGVAGDVEPVTSPAFAEGRRGEQAVDEFLGRLRVLVGDEGGDFLGGRVEAPEGERQATNDDFAGRLGIEVESGRLQLREHETIKRLADLGLIGGSDDRRSRSLDGLERPVLARVMCDRRRLGWPRQSLADPFRQRGDRLGRDLLVGARHGFDVLHLGVVDCEDQAADLRLAGYDNGPDFAALEDKFAGIETEAGLLFLGAVALVAIVSEDRADLLFEELDLGGRRGGSHLRGGSREGEEKGAIEKPERHRKRIGQGGVPLVPKTCWLSSGCKAVRAVFEPMVG